jgi:hypothetical protein
MSKSEFSKRLEIFKDTLREIDILNNENPEATFGVNKFSDHTIDEVFKSPNTPFPEGKQFTYRNTQAKPSLSEINWVERGVVHPIIRDRKDCVASWAFAGADAIAGAYTLANKLKSPILFSAQEGISCINFFETCQTGFSF